MSEPWKFCNYLHSAAYLLVSHVQLFANQSLPASSVRGLFRQKHWSELPFPPPGDLPDPGIKPLSLASHVLAGGFWDAIWEAPNYLHNPYQYGI